HTFIGWSESYTNIMQETSINALYEVNTYAITYNPNGGEAIEGDVYNFGEAVTLPIPVRFGYKFMGWFMGDTANSPKATDGMLLRNDLTLYARWQKETAITVYDEEELNMAIEDPSVEEIIFGNDIFSDEEYYIGRSLNINGNGYTLYFTGLYGLFRVSTQNHNFTYEDSLPSGGTFEVRDLDIIADSGIPDYEGYSAFVFERVQNMDVRFDNISITGTVGEAIGIYETNEMDFLFVDSFFDVQWGGISGYMNETLNINIINSTIKSHYNIYLADIWNSAIDVYNSEFYIMNNEDEYGAGFINYSSGYNDFNFYNTNFYVDEIIEGAEGGSGIIVSAMEGDYQQVQLYNCNVESNNPNYDQLFYSDGMYTSYYLVNSTLEFKEGIINIGDFSYRDTEFTRIVLPESLVTIGEYAFAGNYNLVSIVIPEGVTSIGDNAFLGCVYLGSVVIPSNVTYIGQDVFDETNSNLVIFLMEGIDTSGYNALWINIETLVEENVQSVGKIDGITYVGLLTATVTVIDFDGESEDIVIPKTIEIDSVPTNVKAIHAYAFANTSSLRSVYIPNSVEMIGDGAFYWAENLRTVTFEDNSMLNTIGYEAFVYCEHLESIFIPASVTEIGDYAFSDNYRLEEVIFEEGINLLNIPDSMFAYCETLKEIIIPASVIEIGDGAFNGCMRLRSIIFEEGSLLTTIEDYAFNGLHALTEVYIPETVTLIGEYGFANNYNLQTVDFGLNPSLVTIENYAFSQGFKIEGIILPETVTSIGNGAFRDCEELKSINIPSGVILIPNDFCYNCDELEEVIFPLDSQVTTIGTHAFYGNDMLNNIVLPEGVTSLSYGAFSNCYSLESITIPAGVLAIPDYAFSYNTSLSEVIFASDNQLVNIGAYAFNRCESLETIDLPSSVAVIGNYAFSFCLSLTEIFISDTVVNMGVNVFNNCPLLTISVEHVSLPGTWNTGWLGDMSATVIWAVNHRTITIELDNGDADLVIFEKIGTVIAQPDDPVKVDYTFIGWFIFDGVDWVPYTFTTMPEEDVTIKAFWILN
ncbi:MAG: leucine-rich repeat protein, partial [Candidatus Izemoplasmatales bacterium]|nr:leucine-rich repeat protein [Candidatus Izemoplasmatales bacterium]